MSCVHSIWIILTLAGIALGLDSPTSFVKKSVANANGLPGWYTSPARRGSPSFGFSYWDISEIEDEWAVSAAGEWGNRSYRVSFFYYYSEMDSLFREHYGEWNAAYGFGPAILGASYGTLLEWVPQNAHWVRHRLKIGTGLQWNSFYGSLWSLGFTDETWSGIGSVSWTPSKSFSVSVESDGNSVSIGHDFFFKFGSLSSFYSFPHFSVGIELVLSIKKIECGGTHGFGNGNLGWNGLWIRKKMYLQNHDSHLKN